MTDSREEISRINTNRLGRHHSSVALWCGMKCLLFIYRALRAGSPRPLVSLLMSWRLLLLCWPRARRTSCPSLRAMWRAGEGVQDLQGRCT